MHDRTLPDVPQDTVAVCVEAARGFGPDMVIGIGGGSCLDMAKCASLLLAHGGALADYYGEFKVPGPVLPVVAVPTTAGTGSEVTPVAVVSDPDRILKVGISSPYLIAAAAICDPELTLSCPPRLTAIAGADALTHAIEAFTAMRRPGDPELAQQHVFALAALYEEAGVPPGVVNVMTTSTPGPVIAAMLADPRVRKLSFTGSTGVGRTLLAEASKNVILFHGTRRQRAVHRF
ncbi:alcohol dehydrogenase class IV [Rhizobium leguminosarum]